MKKTVVITGGTKGLGREIALAFGRAGYCVLALYSSDDAAAQEAAKALEAAGARGCFLRQDVINVGDEIWRRPEIEGAESLTLIHNACAPFVPTPMHQMDWTDFESSLQVAIKGSWQCVRGLIRPMLKTKRGTIVHILSSAIEAFPPKGFAAYITAKHALRGLTLALAAEYGAMGVRVFSASPGFMHTPLTANWDARLRDAIESASVRITDPAEAGRRLLELVENPEVAGKGEDYSL